jgi:Rieske Fe-S protein
MPTADPKRRRFLSLVTKLVIAVLGLLVAIPAIGYLIGPLRRKSGAGGDEAGFRDVGPLSDIPLGQWHLLSLEVVHSDGWRQSRLRHAIWVRRHGEGSSAITVLSSICPHLGCPINWHPNRSQFNCPCHGGIFDADGRQVGGPPPRSMDRLEFEVRGGHLWVRWQDFKIGVPERTSVRV